MKILLYDIPNTLNYGSMMMAENYMYYTNSEETDFLVITPKPIETRKRLMDATDNKTNVIAITHNDILGNSKLEKILNLLTGKSIREFIRDKKIDEVIVLGGDDYSEDYGIIYPLINLLEFLHFERYNVQVKMVGQTIGPFKSWHELVFKHLLSKVSIIYTRDPITYKYLTKDFKLKNVQLSADLAFLPLAKEHSDAFKIENLNLLPQNYITIVPSGLIWKYGKDKNRSTYLDFLFEISEYIIKSLNYKLVLLPHVVTEDDVYSDLLLCRDLYINLMRSGFKDEDVVFMKDILLPYQARKILGESKFVITGRMHAAISAFEQGIPAICLAYSRKYHGIIGEYFGMEDLIIDIRDINWNDTLNLIIKCVNYIKDNYSRTVDSIESNVNSMQKKLEIVFNTASIKGGD